MIRGAGLAGGGYLFAQALNLGVYAALSRLLDPADFGLYASATVLIIFGVFITESGMHSAVVHRQDRVEEAKSTAFAATFVVGLLLSLSGLAISPLIGLIFDSGRVTELAAVASGLIFINTLAVVPNAILQRRFSPVRPIVIDPLEVVAFGAVSIVLAVEGLGPWALLIGQYAAIATSTTLAWVFAGWRPRVQLMSMELWRELVSYGRHILVSTVIAKLGGQATDTVIVGKALGPASLGQFRYAFRVASLPFFVLLAGAGYVIFPALARINHDRVRLQTAFLRSLRWMATLGFPAGLALVPLGPAATVIAFGDVWAPAGNATIAMCLYGGGTAVTATVIELLKADGETSQLTRLNLVIAIATAVSMLALVPLGLSAVAAAMSIGAVAGGAYSLRVAVRTVGVSLASMWEEIWKPAVAAIVMALVVLPLDRLLVEPATHGTGLGLLLLVLEGLLCTVVFLAALALLAPHVVREGLETIRSRQWRGGTVEPDAFEEPVATMTDV